MSLSEFAIHLAEVAATEAVEIQKGLGRAAEVIEKAAKKQIGHYQPAVGPFPAWAPLAESTQAQRERLGYTPNDPLYRSGELKDHITHTVEAFEAMIGVKEGDVDERGTDIGDIAIWMELGTRRVPARPYLGPAAYRTKKKVGRILAASAVAGIVGGNFIHHSLGYDMEAVAED